MCRQKRTYHSTTVERLYSFIKGFVIVSFHHFKLAVLSSVRGNCLTSWKHNNIYMCTGIPIFWLQFRTDSHSCAAAHHAENPVFILPPPHSHLENDLLWRFGNVMPILQISMQKFKNILDIIYRENLRVFMKMLFVHNAYFYLLYLSNIPLLAFCSTSTA